MGGNAAHLRSQNTYIGCSRGNLSIFIFQVHFSRCNKATNQLHHFGSGNVEALRLLLLSHPSICSSAGRWFCNQKFEVWPADEIPRSEVMPAHVQSEDIDTSKLRPQYQTSGCNQRLSQDSVRQVVSNCCGCLRRHKFQSTEGTGTQQRSKLALLLCMVSTSSANWSSKQIPTSGQTNSVASHLTHCRLRFGSSSPFEAWQNDTPNFEKRSLWQLLQLPFGLSPLSPTSKTWHAGRAAMWLQLFMHGQDPCPHCWKRKGLGHSLQHTCAFRNLSHMRLFKSDKIKTLWWKRPRLLWPVFDSRQVWCWTTFATARYWRQVRLQSALGAPGGLCVLFLEAIPKIWEAKREFSEAVTHYHRNPIILGHVMWETVQNSLE